jgi:uncharacterized protein (DUF4415 family)
MAQLCPDFWFENVTLRIPAVQAKRLVSIEPDVLRWFEAHGGECGAAINSVLRRYIDRNDGENGTIGS